MTLGKLPCSVLIDKVAAYVASDPSDEQRDISPRMGRQARSPRPAVGLAQVLPYRCQRTPSSRRTCSGGLPQSSVDVGSVTTTPPLPSPVPRLPGLCRDEDLTAPAGRDQRGGLDFHLGAAPPSLAGTTLECGSIRLPGREPGPSRHACPRPRAEGSPGWAQSKVDVEKKLQVELTADPSAWTVCPCQSCGPRGPALPRPTVSL